MILPGYAIPQLRKSGLLDSVVWEKDGAPPHWRSKKGPGTAYHFRANVRATSQHTFERSRGHSKVCCRGSNVRVKLYGKTHTSLAFVCVLCHFAFLNDFY